MKPEEPNPLVTFAYRGHPFLIGTEPAPNGTFRPTVFEMSTAGGNDRLRLPDDTDNAAYATREEALRHAEQQAMRWVHDRTIDGRGNN